MPDAVTPATRIPVNDLRRSWVVERPEVGEAVARVIASGWYVHGPEHAAFEAELADYLGVRHVAGVASGTDALVLALLGVGCGSGSEVVTCANAGGYTSTAVAQLAGRVVYCEVDPRTLVMTRDTVERAIGPATRAVVVTHLYGNVVDVAAIVDVCRPRGIRVIEDCAQAIGATDASGHRVGSLGDAAAFSFYPTKNLGAVGDGGAIAATDDAIDARVRSLRQYGWTAKYRIGAGEGRNSRLDEIQAAVLRAGLPQLDVLNERRREIVRRYQTACAGTEVSVVTGAGCETVAHLAVVRTRERDRLRTWMDERGIDTDIHYPVADHRQPGLRPPARTTNLRESERAVSEVLTLPCFPRMTDDEVDHVASSLRSFGSSGQ